MPVSSNDTIGRVSVVMATYNGIAYLRDQMDSLFRQTRRPDEIIVYDDASTDGTTELLRQIAAQAPSRITVLEGKHNRGVNAAFQSAVDVARGDIVFFCDQDDIWLSAKIERCLSALDASPGAGFVFCDATQFNSSAGDLDKSLWQHAKFSTRRRAAFRRDPVGTMLTGGNFVYGMASAFRRDLLGLIPPVDCDPAGMTHDTWFALHAAALGFHGVALPERLVRYRRHAAQTSVVLGGAGGHARINKAKFRAAELISALRKMRSNVCREAQRLGMDVTTSLAVIDRKIAFVEARETMRREQRFMQALRGMFNPDYWLLASGPASVLRDYRGIW